MHYAVPRLLHEAGLLERFFTDSYVGNKPWLAKALAVIPASLRPHVVRQWLGRSDSVLPPNKVTSFEWFGLWYAAARKRVRAADVDRLFEEAARRFCNHVGVCGLEDASAVWGFNGAALELFRVAAPQGLHCVLEQTILPTRLMHQLLREEVRRWPGWVLEADAEKGFADRTITKREEQEWQFADRIVVGSDFVRSGLVKLGVPQEKIRVVPYGVDTSRFPLASDGRSYESRPVRLLFAGEVGLRKGVPDLLHALDLLPTGAVELKLAGRVALARDRLSPWRDRAEFLGAVPRPQMRELFRWADVLVLPSIVEGSATVTYEALMSGIPVIATPNAGSMVRDGVDGFVVPIRDSTTLAAAIARYCDNRQLLALHRKSAWEGRDRVGLDRYRRELVALFAGLAAATEGSTVPLQPL